MQKPPSQQDLSALSFLSVYKTSGLSDAMTGLLGYLQGILPVARINCMYALKDGSLVTLVSDTTSKLTPEEFRPFVMPERLEEVVIVDDIPLLRRERGVDKDDPRLSGRSFSTHHSMLRFPLFSTLERVFVVHIWSDEANAFTMRDYDFIYPLIAPLAEDLLQALSSLDGPLTPVGHQPISHNQRLAQCAGMAQVLHLIKMVAPTDSPVLILGETGVGKSETAAAIHELSGRKGRSFIHVNCGAIPESLLESELFGHERGAFTGAHSLRQGYFEQANGGTIFLDEIGEMSPSAQVRLLRIFDKGSINRVGSVQPIHLDVRIIAATNADLRQRIEQGTFRKDLWYRLSVFPLRIPPLRERQEDILTLANYFLKAKMHKLKRKMPAPLPGKELARLYAYDWPGNVRELEHVIERSLILHPEREKAEFTFQLDVLRAEEANGALSRDETKQDAAAEPGLTEKSFFGGWPSLLEMEQRYIEAVLRETRGKLTGPGSATEILGIHYSTLRTHMRELGLPTERQKRRIE